MYSLVSFFLFLIKVCLELLKLCASSITKTNVPEQASFSVISEHTYINLKRKTLSTYNI